MDLEILKRLVYRGYEGTDVDYKRDMPWDKPEKYSIIKSILAFANRGGGYIVIGVDEDGEHPEDQRVGVSEENRRTWEGTKVCVDLNKFAGPPINLEVIPFPDVSENKSYIVLSIPGHGEVPHLCVADRHDQKGDFILRRAALYYRNDNKESAEISDPVQYEKLIRRCLTLDREKLLTDIRAIIEGAGREQSDLPSAILTKDMIDVMDKCRMHAEEFEKAVSKDHVFQEVIAVPSSLEGTVDSDRANQALASACVDYRGWPLIFFLPAGQYNVYPQHDNDKIYSYSNQPFGSREIADYWAFYYDGYLYIRMIAPESSVRKSDIFDPFLQVRLMAESAIAFGRVYGSLDLPIDSHLDIAVRYSPLKEYQVGRTNDFWDRGPMSRPYKGSMLTLQFREPLSELLSNPHGVAARVVVQLMRKIGYDGEITEAQLGEHAAEKLRNGKRLEGGTWKSVSE